MTWRATDGPELPAENETVLLVDTKGTPYTGWRTPGGYWVNDSVCPMLPTHWMPLPPRPDEDPVDRRQDAVRRFMEAAEQDTPACPVIPNQKVRSLRASLIHEELAEFNAACHECQTALVSGDEDRIVRALVQVADAIVDLDYVVKGAGVAFGMNLAPMFDEVHRSNMSKFIDGHRRPDGKWMKGPSYKAPNLEPIIRRQMKGGAE